MGPDQLIGRQEKSAEEFFEALNGGEALDREKFLDFLKGPVGWMHVDARTLPGMLHGQS